VECALLGFVLVALGLALAIAAVSSSRSGQWNEAFGHVARRFHGTLYPGGWIHTPGVWLQHGEAQARLTISTIRGAGRERCVQFTIQQREIQNRGEIFYYQTRETLLPLKRGLSSVEFDWEDFRRRWQVLADDGDAMRQLLSDGVRLAIEMLWRQPIPSEMLISLSPGWLVVRKVWHNPRGIDVEGFVERACALSDQLNLAAAAGIEFISGNQPQLLESARCGVCGDGLAHEIVVCRRCNTPHHRECWQYGGGCATYGCGGRECAVPGVAPLARPHYGGLGESLVRPAKPR
jgi:hypothetical protein